MHLTDKETIYQREGLKGGELGEVKGRVARKECDIILLQLKIFF